MKKQLILAAVAILLAGCCTCVIAQDAHEETCPNAINSNMTIKDQALILITKDSEERNLVVIMPRANKPNEMLYYTNINYDAVSGYTVYSNDQSSFGINDDYAYIKNKNSSLIYYSKIKF